MKNDSKHQISTVKINGKDVRICEECMAAEDLTTADLLRAVKEINQMIEEND